MKHESFKKPLTPAKHFYERLFYNFLLAACIIFIVLSIGVAGYMSFAKLKFEDALLNACMILSGMGPVDTMTTKASKYFASAYALFSGVVFLSTIAVLFAPVVHRAMHAFHLKTEENEENEE